MADPARVGTTAYSPAAGALGVRRLETTRSPERLAGLVDRYAAGELAIEVRPFPLAEAAAAHRAVETRHVRGKVVLLTEESG